MIRPLTRRLNRQSILFFLFLFALMVAIAFGFWLQRPNALYIAVVGPMSGPQQRQGRDMVKGVEMYLDEANQAGGVNGKPIKLLVFDDQNNPDLARKKAIEIAKNKKVLAVLGHLYSSTSIKAGEVYRESRLPAISGSATAEKVTTENDWYFRVIFNNRLQGTFVANYIYRIFKERTASIIYDRDDYGESLKDAFEKTFQGLGGKIENQWAISADPQQLERDRETILNDLLQEKVNSIDPGVLFFATHGSEAVALIAEMKRKGLTHQIFGADSLGEVKFAQNFNQYPEEQASPGYFSDGIYATSPVIFDVSSERGQEFRQNFTAKYDLEPGWTAATYYDAALVVVEAIQRATVRGVPAKIQEDRQKIREVLMQINTLSTAIEGIEGQIYFDTNRNGVRQVPIGVFKNQNFIPALTQVQQVTDIRQITDLERELEAGDILLVDSQYMHKTNVVYTGVDINELSNIDMKSSSYTVDFYIWFRYRGDLEADRVEFTNLIEEPEIKTLIQKNDTGQLHYRAYRIKGNFKGNFLFHDYPFDEQNLDVKFRHANLKRDDLIYVQDVVGMRNVSDRAILSKFSESKVLNPLSGWQLKQARFFQDIIRDDSTLGNPEFLDLKFDDKIEYSRFNIEIKLRRNSFSFILKNLLPVLLLIIATYLILFIPADAIAPKAVAGLNALLTTAFFHTRLSSDLPNIGYVVAIEYVFYAMYLLCLFGLFISIFSYVELKRNHDRQLKRLDRLGKTLYPAVLFISSLVFASRYIIIPAWGDGPRERQQPSSPAAVNPTIVDTDTVKTEAIPLTLGSWRTDDRAKIERILAAFHEKYPRISVQFVPTDFEVYDSVLESQLEREKAPDLFYLRPFSGARKFIQAGYLTSLGDFPELNENFTPEAIAPWRGPDGEPYGLPTMAVYHGIYYNVDIFQRLGLTPPQTWEELQQTARRLQNAGYIPFANGSESEIAVVERIFMTLAPNFIGGREGRQQYLRGDRCFNDRNAIAAFEAMADLRSFLPPQHETIGEAESQQLFLDGKAAMWFGGSWDISPLKSANPDLNWSVFATPPPAGEPGYITVHPDFAIALNAASPHREEAKRFLQWLMSPKAAKLLGDELPGFFPLNQTVKTVADPQAKAFFQLSEKLKTDVRWASPRLGEGLPDGFSLMQKGAVGVIQDTMTPQAAADNLQQGLSQWFEPAQTCNTESASSTTWNRRGDGETRRQGDDFTP